MDIKILSSMATVLEALLDEKPNCVSDILNGYQKFPDVPSDRHDLFVEIENGLIDGRLVTITDRRGTINGYRYFVINSSGKQWLSEFKKEHGKIAKNIRIDELDHAIDRAGIVKQQFRIPAIVDNEITITRNGTLDNFYIHLQQNKEFYTIRRTPPPLGEETFITDVSSWKEVMSYFEIWLKTIGESLVREQATISTQVAPSGDSVIPTSTPVSTKSQVKNIVLNALSTKINDRELTDQGLSMIGILGYILVDKIDESTPLIRFDITFRGGRKKDILYTANEPKERLEGRTPEKVGPIGYVFVSEKTGTIRLQRYWNGRTFDHLYLTELVTSYPPKGYNDETAENPVYIYKKQEEGTVPLFLFSTKGDFGFVKHPEPYLESSIQTVSEEEKDLINDLKEEIRKIKLDFEAFRFTDKKEWPNREEIVVIVGDADIDYSFKLNRVDAEYTVTLHSSGKQLATFQSLPWEEVKTKFVTWLETIQSLPGFISKHVKDMGNAKGVVLGDGPSDFTFRNDEIKGVLDIHTQTQVFFKLLKSIRTNERGTLLGIFGKWGRGKTFFWKKLIEVFDIAKKDSTEGIEFIPVEFHAWKYQDTPASWAYLYEGFVKTFYKQPVYVYFRQYRWFPINGPSSLLSFLNRFRLNLKRLGAFAFVYGTFMIMLAFVWYFIVDFETKWDLFKDISGYLGAAFIFSAALFLRFTSGTARELFKKYFSKTSFVDLMGIQAEIQKEFTALFKVWIPDHLVGKKRVILFVDDIDRCNEERIIQVIDSLKVMMDDPCISQRAIVMAAVDETVLKRAIKLKYHQMIMHDLSLPKEKRNDVQEKLCREYMDKLFLNGFKLGTLQLEDRIAILDTLTDGHVFFRNEDKKEEKFKVTEVADRLPEKISEGDEVKTQVGNISSDEVDPAPKTGEQNAQGTDPDDLSNYIFLLPQADKELMDYEIGRLVSAIEGFREATPRAIRIFYYRYLLAKYFKDLIIKESTSVWKEWQLLKDADKAILPHLIVEYGSIKDHAELLSEIERLRNGVPGVSRIKSLGREFVVSGELYFSLLRIVEAVVPY